MCFIAIENEVNIDDNSLYDELSVSYDELLENSEKFAIKHSIFKTKNSLLKKR